MFFNSEPKKPTIQFHSEADERNFARSQVDAQAKAYQPAPEPDNAKVSEEPEPEPVAKQADAPELPRDDRHPVQKLLDAADLSDPADHAMIHDAMIDHGMDDEAESLRNGDYESLVDSGLIDSGRALRSGLIDADEYFDPTFGGWEYEDAPTSRHVIDNSYHDGDDWVQEQSPLDLYVQKVERGGNVAYRFATGDGENHGPIRFDREQAVADGREYLDQFDGVEDADD